MSAWLRTGPSPLPPSQSDPTTLWFEKGQSFEQALAGRAKESIRAVGGAVEGRSYGGNHLGQELPNLEYADLRESGWTEIGPKWFRSLKRLSRVELPPELEKISSHAFSGDEVLSEIWYPERLKEIGEAAFDRCYGLREVALPPGFETLGCMGFSWCLSLESVALPWTMKLLGKLAFRHCQRLETLVVGDVEKWSEDVLEDVTNVKELRLIGKRWEGLHPATLAKCLRTDAGVIGRNFVGRKLRNIAITAE